ncbi:MAG: hypothetical protein U5L04_04235 [Trueperaceae bacterium]|nr:hypothetical protein [Trueperaceae bacterium]
MTVSPVARSERLSAVFEDDETVPLGHVHHRAHRRWQSEKMDRQDRFGAFGYGVFELVRVEVKGRFVYIDEDRRRADAAYRFGGREKAKRGGDDLVARSDP